MAKLAEPVITWLVKKTSDIDYMEKENYFAGNYSPHNGISLDLRIWNNRYGSEPVQNLEHFGIAMKFDSYEDSALFNYMECIINNAELLSPSVVAGEALIVIPEEVVLSGAVNDGAPINTDNYMSLSIKINLPGNITIKSNDLKNLSFDIIKL
jgi:hypothetical protein